MPGVPVRSAESGIDLPIQTRAAAVRIHLGLNVSDSALVPSRQGSSTIYTNDEFRIEVAEYASKPRSIVRVQIHHLTDSDFTLNGFSVRLKISKDSFAGIWFPGSDVSSKTMMSAGPERAFEGIADANFGIPYAGAVNSKGRTAAALGMGHQNMPVVLSGNPLDNGQYELELRVTATLTGKSLDERFYVSNDSSSTWFDTAANYTDWVDGYTGYKQFPISATAYEPLYDTWYWSGDRVNQDLYLKTAELAAEVGARLFLADSGWDAPNGEYDKWLLGKTGDYKPPADKFPNLPATFEQIRSRFGMGIDLWLQPFAVGRESERYASTKNMHIQIPMNFNSVIAWSGVTREPVASPIGGNLETVNLCPRLNTTVTYLKNLFAEMENQYKPQGYWLDFIDGMATYCVAGHRHTYSTFGDGFKRSLDAIKSTVLASNPNAIVHFRARYANLFTKSFANIWQSEDSPGSYDQMRLNALRLRPFSKGVVFAADELFWPIGTPDARIAKFIMTSVMTGVPAFGANLLYATESERAMLKAWLAFYQENREELVKGKFSPWGSSIEVPNHKIEGTSATYAYIRNLDSTELIAENNIVYLMNATNNTAMTQNVRLAAGSPAYTATILNRYLTTQPGTIRVTPNAAGLLTFRGAVEEGGIVILKPALP